MIGFVLFVDPSVTQSLAEIGRLEFKEFALIVHRIKRKN